MYHLVKCLLKDCFTVKFTISIDVADKIAVTTIFTVEPVVTIAVTVKFSVTFSVTGKMTVTCSVTVRLTVTLASIV